MTEMGFLPSPQTFLFNCCIPHNHTHPNPFISQPLPARQYCPEHFLNCESGDFFFVSVCSFFFSMRNMFRESSKHCFTMFILIVTVQTSTIFF
ncbi:unnamed protein product [Ixodes pacificus]